MKDKRLLELESDLFILESMLSEDVIQTEEDPIEELDIDKVIDILVRSEKNIKPQKNHDILPRQHRTIMIHHIEGKIIMR